MEQIDGTGKAEANILQVELSKMTAAYMSAAKDRFELKADVDSMRPVVDAAVEWVRIGGSTSEEKLWKAVRTFLSKQAPAEPVKDCTTCHHWDNVPNGNCLMPATCNWEPRHD